MASRGQTSLIIFVDSSVLFAAVGSVSGGSAKLFTLDKLQLVVSKIVLAEVERNVRKKLQTYHLDRFFALVAKTKILDQEPDDELITKAKEVIVDKDAVILTESKQAKADYVVTLDRKHFLTPEVAKFLFPKKAVTPKDLLEIIRFGAFSGEKSLTKSLLKSKRKEIRREHCHW